MSDAIKTLRDYILTNRILALTTLDQIEREMAELRAENERLRGPDANEVAQQISQEYVRPPFHISVETESDAAYNANEKGQPPDPRMK